MAKFIEVALLEQIAPGKSKLVYVEEKSIALFNIDGMIYAIDDSCLHQGSSLAQGKLNGKILTCRAHGWKYDVTTGSLTLNPESGVASYAVQVVDGKIAVAVLLVVMRFPMSFDTGEVKVSVHGPFASSLSSLLVRLQPPVTLLHPVPGRRWHWHN